MDNIVHSSSHFHCNKNSYLIVWTTELSIPVNMVDNQVVFLGSLDLPNVKLYSLTLITCFTSSAITIRQKLNRYFIQICFSQKLAYFEHK